MEMNIEMEHKPEWLDSLLQRRFFGPCPQHDRKKNEMNRYCITCDADACRYCISSGCHDNHELLKVYRHVYKDVVLLEEIENYFDSAQIQPYKCNKKWVVSMHPLPHCGSGANIDRYASCDACRRRLTDPHHYRYCCISCKVRTLYQRRNHPTLESLLEVATMERTKRRRKGVPQRAPCN